MKERPILFSAPMVRAILAGAKTQTRRVVKPQPEAEHGGEPYWFVGGYRAWTYRDTQDVLRQGGSVLPCPYGQPGDRLWVRETWSHDAISLDACRAAHEDLMGGMSYGPYYRATEVAPDTLVWRPSIHMPRWASRILLEVDSVRVERLQAISRGDAMAEGCPFPNMAAGPNPLDWFKGLWTDLNGPDSWTANHWVWVINFKRLEARP